MLFRLRRKSVIPSTVPVCSFDADTIVLVKALPPDVILVVAYPPLGCPTNTVPLLVFEAEIVLV